MNQQDVDGGRRLDMNHGFIKSIVKNQIDRDEYHKFMEEKRQQTERNLREAANAARDAQRESHGKKKRLLPVGTKIYVPPHLRRQLEKAGEAGGSPSPDDIIRKRRNFCPMGVVDDLEESELREKARNRLRTQLSEVPTMEFSKSPTQTNQQVKPLFLLNLMNNDGESVEVAVMSTDNAARLAKALSRKHGYTEDQCRQLRLTLEVELEKRQHM